MQRPDTEFAKKVITEIDKSVIGRRWKSYGYLERVQRARDLLIVSTEKERCELDNVLAMLGILGGPDASLLYTVASMMNLNTWLTDARIELEDRLLLQAFERGADCVILGQLHEDSGLITARLTQQCTAFAWKDVESGVQRLARMRGANAREVVRTKELQTRAREVAVLTREELARMPQDTLDVVATLDASLWSTFVGPTAPHGLLYRFLQRKAAALGGTMVVYDGQPEDRITAATVYRARTTTPA